MKKLSLIFLVCISVLLISSCGTPKPAYNVVESRIEGVDIGTDGTYLIKAYSYGNKVPQAMEAAKLEAVRGVVFKGFAGKSGHFSSQAPLLNDASAKDANKAFFDAFFAPGGEYLNYINRSLDESPEIIKVGKGYEVGLIVSVAKDRLREYLEQKGVLKALTEGF